MFIPLTRLCRDRCGYCTFVTVPGRLESMYLSPDEVLAIAREGARLGCKEALFTLGDRPEARWKQAREWLDAHGYEDTLAYVRAMAVRVLEETGLLPHLNPGVLSREDFRRLKPVAPSMGMMLETTATRLFSEKGQPHYGSPDKDPKVRLQVLEDAGRSRVPFTTGILIGIGETYAERADAIFALRAGVRRVRRHPGNHRAELPGQAGHQDARYPRRRAGRARRHHRGHPPGPRPGGARAGPAEPGRPRVPAHDRRRASTTGAASRRSRPTT